MDEVKQIWRCTFGCGMENAGYCQPILGTYSSAREKMFELYGTKWAFQYSEQDWENIRNDPNRKWPMEKDLKLMEV